VEAWRELIDDRCRGIDPTALTPSMRHEASFGLGRIAAEDAAHREAKVSRLVEDLRAIVRNHARDLAWPETGAEAFGKTIAEALRSTGAGPGR
jgi:hypothetical protein